MHVSSQLVKPNGRAVHVGRKMVQMRRMDQRTVEVTWIYTRVASFAIRKHCRHCREVAQEELISCIASSRRNASSGKPREIRWTRETVGISANCRFDTSPYGACWIEIHVVLVQLTSEDLDR